MNIQQRKEFSPDISDEPELQNQQERSADVARHQVNNFYANHGEPNQPKLQDPYNRTHEQTFDWQTYHSAWQEYYQEYYRRYYSNQNPAAQPIIGADESIVDSGKVSSLKNDIKQKVKEQATAIKRSHHFLPIISAIVVGLLFLLLQFNGLLVAQARAYVSPGELEGKSLAIANPTTNFEVGPEPRLIIPKINVDVPVIYDITSLDDPTVQVGLRNGVVHYKVPGADSLPGQLGNSTFLGHSSNDVFAGGDYKFTFLLLDNLNSGDTFFLHYQGVRYTYKVTEKKVINPDQISALQLGYDKPMATLITCTPPGTALRRLLVYGEQISPDPAAASQPAETSGSTQTETIPGNSPTVFERVFNLLFTR